MRAAALLAATMLLTGSLARAQGYLLPQDQSLGPLRLVRQQVVVAIDEQVARTRVLQVFSNPTDRPLEAIFVFPLSRTAAVTGFAMTMNGQRVAGEICERHQARAVYEEIVRRARDPGLLEMFDGNVFRARVFPVPARGEQAVEVTYDELLRPAGGLCEYAYRLRTGADVAAPTANALTLVLRSRAGIRTVYSPTHDVLVTRPSDHEARVSFEVSRTEQQRAFQLFYSLSALDYGANLLAHRRGAEDGYFLLLLTPRVEVPAAQVRPKDVCFVLDTSGSMRGVKLTQAKAALKDCLRHLNPHDRFGLIHFNTDVCAGQAVVALVDPLPALMAEVLPAAAKAVWAAPEKLDLVFHPPTADALRAADELLDHLSAGGSTNLDGALQQALAVPTATGRPYYIFFLTDGQPTVGETNPGAILRRVTARSRGDERIFTFGVGDDVNTVLLDALAEGTKGCANYVRPDEDIAVKLPGLFRRVADPLLTNLALTVTGVQVAALYPPALPDLHRGEQLEVFGRYRGTGAHQVVLAADAVGTRQRFVYDVEFPAAAERDFVAGLWARRKVGCLLDSIRAHGEIKELVDEVKALGWTYGLVTPYTSYLVLEPGATTAWAAPGPDGSIAPALNIDDSTVLKSIDDSTLTTYRAGGSSRATGAGSRVGGKLGSGGRDAGGWPEGSLQGEIRFFCLQHDGAGWDAGLAGNPSPLANFLAFFHKLTQLKTAAQPEAIPMETLAKFHRGHQPPFVYLTGRDQLRTTAAAQEALRKYLLDGGLLIADSQAAAWDANFRQFVQRILPQKQLVAIPDDDPIFRMPFEFPNGLPAGRTPPGQALLAARAAADPSLRPSLEAPDGLPAGPTPPDVTRALGVKHDGRWCVFYVPGGVGAGWTTAAAANDPTAAYELGVNLLYYAFTTNRRWRRQATPATADAAPGNAAGAAAVRTSELIGALKRQTLFELTSVRQTPGRTFRLIEGVWVQDTWRGEPEPLAVKFGSAAYFALVAADPALADVFALGTDVVVALPAGKVLRVGALGVEKLTAAEAEALVRPPK